MKDINGNIISGSCDFENITAQKMRFSIKDFFSELTKSQFPAGLVTFTDEIHNRKLHFLAPEEFRKES